MQNAAKSARCTRAATFAGPLRKRAGWICAFAGAAFVAFAAAGLSSGHAQSAPTDSFIMLPQNSSTIPTIPSPPPVAVTLAQMKPPAQSQATVEPMKTSSNDSTEDQTKQGVAGEASALLKMATALKSEVDKTTKDTLSVAVVRKADEIEQLAHKVRLGAGKD
jgi:hypothetical protein